MKLNVDQSLTMPKLPYLSLFKGVQKGLLQIMSIYLPVDKCNILKHTQMREMISLDFLPAFQFDFEVTTHVCSFHSWRVE